MIRGEVSDSIPIDLIIEILSRLPAKSIARFRCVSKLWGSMLLVPYFTELFLTRSSARPPRLLIVVGEYNDCCFFTSPQLQKPYDEKSSLSLVVDADFHMKFPIETTNWEYSYSTSSLIFFHPSRNQVPIVICNPSTGQYANLPLPKGRIDYSSSFLGFDPVEKQFKLLYIPLPNLYNGKKEEPNQILTLGTGNDSWRIIHCPLNHSAFCDGICINGVLYYLARQTGALRSFMIVCFDVRSETFKFIYKDFISVWYDTRLINYKGKLGAITLKMDYVDGRCQSLELWVIEGVEKLGSSEWSKYFSYSWDNEVVVDIYLSIVGVTGSGEIVLSKDDVSKPFYVVILNPEKSTLQRVEIRGLGDTLFDVNDSIVEVFLDYVEDLKFINMKTTYATSLPEQETTSTII